MNSFEKYEKLQEMRAAARKKYYGGRASSRNGYELDNPKRRSLPDDVMCQIGAAYNDSIGGVSYDY